MLIYRKLLLNDCYQIDFFDGDAQVCESNCFDDDEAERKAKPKVSPYLLPFQKRIEKMEY